MLLSPLKSPDGFVCGSYLKELIKPTKAIRTFLPFSGEVELALLADNRDVIIHTNNYVIYEFWSCFRTDPVRISDQAQSLHRRTIPGMIKTYQQDWPGVRDPYLRSAIFFLLNRYSETGTLSSGNVSMNNYSPMCLNNLRRCDESVTQIKILYHKTEDYLEGIDECPADGVVLLMAGQFNGGPLGRRSNNGHETYDINHRNLKKRLVSAGKDFVLVYKAHRGLPHLYKEYTTILLNKFGKVTKNIALAEEMIITTLPAPP
tara:strand:+ start:198 stop:977 length:780 start_codon:yes stop_codon:yes gene_type:complete